MRDYANNGNLRNRLRKANLYSYNKENFKKSLKGCHNSRLLDSDRKNSNTVTPNNFQNETNPQLIKSQSDNINPLLNNKTKANDKSDINNKFLNYPFQYPKLHNRKNGK